MKGQQKSLKNNYNFHSWGRINIFIIQRNFINITVDKFSIVDYTKDMNKFITEERLQVTMKMSISPVDIKTQIKAT